MGTLVGRVGGQRLPQGCDGRRVVVARLVERGQLEQQVEMLLAEQLAPVSGPILVTILGQEVAGIQVERGAVGHGILATPCIGGGSLEGFDVDPQGVPGVEAEDVVLEPRIARGARRTGCECVPGSVEYLVEAIGGRRQLKVRPEEVHDLLAV